MIHTESLSQDWILSVGARLGKVDKALLEKAIRALFLAEQIQIHGLNFLFKGGTSLLIQLPSPRRFSIDVDIVTTDKREHLTRVLDSIVSEGQFNRWEEDIRQQARRDLPVEHFKLFYTSHFPGLTPENYILLDVIYQTELPSWSEEKPLEHDWLKSTGDSVLLKFSTLAGLLGDKLTAFAPTTTGILYTKNRPLEIIKQLYDIGALFSEVDNIAAVRSVFEQVCAQEIAFRGLNIGPEEVLNDTFKAALTICTRDEKDPNFVHLKTGIANIKPHIFNWFIIDDAIVAAAKVLYVTTLLRTGHNGPPERFASAQEVVDWEISDVEFNRFNRFRRTNPEAFFLCV